MKERKNRDKLNKERQKGRMEVKKTKGKKVRKE
jgi:hypothetical protein